MRTTSPWRVRRTASLALGALALFGLPTSAQGENPFEARGGSASSAEPGPALPEPGVLPEGTSSEAAELWAALCAATRAPLGAPESEQPGATADSSPVAERAPLRSFDVTFDATIRRAQQKNDATFRQRYLAPNFVRTVILEGGGERELGRDADGYWLRDPKDRDQDGNARVVRLDDRAYATDRRQIDDALAVSESFRAFADPSALRLIRLALATPPLSELPDECARVGAQLLWLEIESPDFHLPGAPRVAHDGRPLSAWVRMGLHPETHLVRQALVTGPARQAAAGGPVTRAAHFLILGGERNRYRAYDGFQLPMGIDLWQYTLQETTVEGNSVRTPLDATEKPGQSFALKHELLVNPPLTEDDFRP